MQRTPSILVIEDDPLMGELIALHLSFGGYDNVHIAEDAVQGGRMLLESRPDLLITDIMMPYLDGLELLEAMRGDENARDIPVILCSVKHDEASIAKAKQFGASAFLQKPLDSEMLLATVKRVLDDPTPM